MLENVILGGEPSRFGFVIKYDEARKKLLEIAETYHLDIDPDEYIPAIHIYFNDDLTEA